MLINIENRERPLADFLIIGAAKSGTTSLYHYLGQHPALYFPRELKEPGYLCFADMQRPTLRTGLPDMWQSAITQLDAYSDLFEGAPRNSLLGEATPEYLLLAERTVRNIKRLYADRAERLKFVAILRNPVDRIWSHYWMMVRDGYENLPIEEAISERTISSRMDEGWNPAYDYLGYGMYGRQLRTYLDNFGSDRMHVVLFEDFRDDTQRVCTSLFEFLGVESTFAPNVSVEYNHSGVLRFPKLHEWLFIRQHAVKRMGRLVLPNDSLQRIKAKIVRWNSRKLPMPSEMRVRLLEMYKEEIVTLSRLIGRELNHWLVP